MERKESTPTRENRRRYEEKHKEKRKAANRIFGTSIPRQTYEEIDEFLQTHNISKVTLIIKGFEVLKAETEKNN